MRIHHALGEFRVYKNQYQKVMDILEKGMADAEYDFVITDCTEDSYYVSIIPGRKCECGGKCKDNSEKENTLTPAGIIYNISQAIMNDKETLEFFSKIDHPIIKKIAPNKEMELAAIVGDSIVQIIHHMIETDVTLVGYEKSHNQMMEIAKYIASTPILKDMYANFLETDEQKEKFKEGKVDAEHVAEKAHLVLDRTITSLIDKLGECGAIETCTIGVDESKGPIVAANSSNAADYPRSVATETTSADDSPLVQHFKERSELAKEIDDAGRNALKEFHHTEN